ncbi:MAG: PSD1 and planctomycete cytochrome C domain-containing protein [Planctomycetota bacterium]|nr:PSD1 and planctomycete cytochrome C domain-containing protein [Planctomycetota bacterium]
MLIDRCEACHSSAKGKTSGGLALDTRAGWIKGGDSGSPIVPGEPEESLLIRAVRHTDSDLQMPPKDRGGKLADTEIAALVEWVTRGAVDPRVTAERIGGMSIDAARGWWSFQPVRTPVPPEVRDVTWPATPIDQFILAEQERRGMTHVALADRRTLLRRVTFDLTGLPPTTAELAAFLADESPAAFETVVERLLASPSYGERWGRHWLDVARYADTAGDGADYPVREAYKYRDWVVQAFNADQPFDQFLREQIAGDILAQAGPAELYGDRVTATGFLAVGKRYGYAPNSDYQHLDFADAIDSLGRSLLGLSLGCARCHDHKYEPVTTNDYYALYGILQSTKWSFPGGEEMKRPVNFPPLIPPSEAAMLDAGKSADVARLDGEISRLKSERARLDGKSFAGGVDLAFEGQPIGKPPAAPWLSAGPNSVIADAQSPYTHIHPEGSRGVRVGSGLATDGIRYVFESGLRATPKKQMHFTLDFRTVPAADKTQEKPGAYRFYVGRGVIESLAVECSVTAGEFAIRSGAKPGTWYTLRLTLDPTAKTYSGVVGTVDDLVEFRDKGLGPNWDGVVNTFICDGFGHVAGPASERDLDNIGLQETPFAAPGSVPVTPPAKLPDAAERLAKVDADLALAQKARDSAAARVMYEVAYGVSEGTPANARIQRRGEPDKPGEEVNRRFVEILGGDRLTDDSHGSGRLELANWLTRDTNPLTARVFVNRVWQWHFGQGLVTTPSDFGARGELPSHPELLDWLTARFIASGWSVKTLHRLILGSRVYQLASDDDPENLRHDPGNRWLWRYQRRTLDAESIRDAMLAVSGQLDRAIPGQHPFPPVASWGFTIHQPFHAVYDSSHRSVYLMLQRNRRHPFLALFDAADPNLSVAERLPTTTPTQTLYLMNSPFVHEQSTAFAARALREQENVPGRIRFLFEASQGRFPTEGELAETEIFVTRYAAMLADRGESTDRQTLGAWSALARVLLTSNGFLSVD